MWWYIPVTLEVETRGSGLGGCPERECLRSTRTAYETCLKNKTVLLIELETITELSMVVRTLIPALLRQRQEHHCQCEASLV